MLLVELLAPEYEEAVGTLTYEARPVRDYTGTGLAHFAQRQADADLVRGFDHVSLLIASAVSVCGASAIYCCPNGGYGLSGEGCIYKT